MTRVLGGLASALLTVLLLGVLLLALLAGTPLGTGLLLRVADRVTDGRLTITGAGGSLVTGLTIDGLQLELATVTVQLDAAEIGVFWPDLLRGQLTLQDARSARLRIHITPDPDAPGEPVQALLLPVVIAADDLAIAAIEVQQGDDPPVVLEGARLTGRLERGDLVFTSLAIAWSGIALEADGRFGTGEPFAVAAQARMEWPEAGVRGTGTLSGSLASLAVAAELAVPDPVTVTGTAELLDGSPSLVLKARSAAVRRPLDDATVLALTDLAVDLEGWLDSLRTTASATVVVTGLPPARVEVAASGSLERLVFDRLVATTLGGRITGSGELALAPELAGNFRLAAENINPATIDPRFPGRLAASAQLQFTGSGDLRLVVDRVTGELFRRRFTASGTVTRSGEELAFDDVRVAAGVNRVALDGRLGAALSGRFSIDAPDLPTLWPGLSGSLAGRGDVGGTLERPTLRLDVDGTDLAYAAVAARSVSVRGGIGRADAVDLAIAVRGLTAGGEALGDLDAGALGTLSAHDVTLRLAGGVVGLDIASGGGLKQGVWQQALAAATIDLPGNSRWELDEPTVLRVAADRVSIDGHCWSSGAARLCVVDSSLRGAQLSAGASLRDLPLAVLGPWLPEALALGGTADLDVEVRRDAAGLDGSLRLAPRNVVVTWAVPDDDDLRTELVEAQLEVTARGDVVAWEGAVADTFGISLQSRGEVSDVFGADPSISGAVAGAIPDLARLSPLADQLADAAGLAGSVSLAAALSGRLRAPTIDGGLDIADASFTVPAAGITVDRINVAVTGGADGRATILGNARSGKGYVQITGDLAFDDRLAPAARLAVQGRQFDVINIPDGYAQVSPNVTVVLSGGQFRVGGELLVARAEIRPQRVGGGAVEPSPDTIVHGREEARPVRSRPLFVLDGLRVRLGNDVRFDGLGLKADLGGSLTLYQNLPGDPFAVTADGVVQVTRGRFTALGQVLTIERGSLLFAGVVTDPGLDVRASREIVYEGRTVTAGVILSGTLSRIETRVFSEPAMGEMDALAYITTGKPLSAATTGDRLSVANAALTLGMRGALPVAKQFSEALRVDELGIEGAGGENTAVVVGERIGDDLYVRYSYGIFDQVGTIQVTYRLGPRLSIEGSSGQSQALYLVYSITW